jgi:GT2 family glycosyltransferase
MSQKLTIQIVGWNSAEYLRRAAIALRSLSSEKVTIRYIDNNSSDDSLVVMKELLPRVDIVALKENMGFAGAHNIGMASCTTPFIFFHDPDVVLNAAYLAKLLDAFNDPTVGAVQGKVWRADQTNIIDSTGIVLTSALNGRERGANEEDRGQYNSPAALIAVTGGCSVYRVTALEDVAHSATEYFDNDFFAYKEDVDLGWRLNRAGWKVLYVPIGIATHARTLGRRGTMNWGLDPRVIYQRLRSPRTRYSLRNWVWMIVKNASIRQEVTHEPFILTRLLVFFFFSLVYPPLFSVWGEIIQGIPTMIAKRKKALS